MPLFAPDVAIATVRRPDARVQHIAQPGELSRDPRRIGLIGDPSLLRRRETIQLAQQALAHGITPIVCLGETLQQRQAGQTVEVVKRQLAAVIPLNGHCISEIVVAYEPVWAIGTGQTATAEQAQEVHAAIRGWLRELGGDEAAAGCRIQYGGSVKADNAAELLALPDVDGALVGGASLKAEEFLKIVAAAPRRQ